VIFETNRYSVPHNAAFAKVTIKAYVDRVAIVHHAQVVSEHQRGYGKHESFVDPLHFVAALERKPAWLDHVPALRDWNLPASFAQLRTTFKERLGPRTGERHYIRVLQLLMRHPTARIDRAIGMLIHKDTLTAELIAQTADRLARDDDGAEHTESLSIHLGQNELIGRVQVPMPDLRRFDQLLFDPIPPGDCHVRNQSGTPVDVTSAQPQNPEAADHAGRICQAGAAGG
jgi:hypothetical protein